MNYIMRKKNFFHFVKVLINLEINKAKITYTTNIIIFNVITEYGRGYNTDKPVTTNLVGKYKPIHVDIV